MYGTNKKFAASEFEDFQEVVQLYASPVGAVYVGTFKYDRIRYVLKQRKYSELGGKNRKDVMHEVSLLNQLDNPHVIKCEGWFANDVKHSVYIVLEYCPGGDLHGLIQRQKRYNTNNNFDRYFPENYIWYVFAQICEGVKCMHEIGIVHRDLKPMNIFCSPDYLHFKVGDLGVSRQVSEDTLMLQTHTGTPLYISPELLENKLYNERTDIWSLGVILYELCALTTPFRGKSILQLAQSIIKGNYDPLPPQFAHTPHLGKCIKGLLNVEFMRRPSILALLQYIRNRIPSDYDVHKDLETLVPLTPTTAQSAAPAAAPAAAPSAAVANDAQANAERVKRVAAGIDRYSKQQQQQANNDSNNQPSQVSAAVQQQPARNQDKKNNNAAAAVADKPQRVSRYPSQPAANTHQQQQPPQSPPQRRFRDLLAHDDSTVPDNMAATVDNVRSNNVNAANNYLYNRDNNDSNNNYDGDNNVGVSRRSRQQHRQRAMGEEEYVVRRQQPPQSQQQQQQQPSDMMIVNTNVNNKHMNNNNAAAATAANNNSSNFAAVPVSSQAQHSLFPTATTANNVNNNNIVGTNNVSNNNVGTSKQTRPVPVPVIVPPIPIAINNNADTHTNITNVQTPADTHTNRDDEVDNADDIDHQADTNTDARIDPNQVVRISTQRLQVLLRRELNRFRKLMQEKHLFNSNVDIKDKQTTRSQPQQAVTERTNNTRTQQQTERTNTAPTPPSSSSCGDDVLVFVKSKIDAMEKWLSAATKSNNPSNRSGNGKDEGKTVDPFIDIKLDVATK
jgi:serine/threonine protein kinase